MSLRTFELERLLIVRQVYHFYGILLTDVVIFVQINKRVYYLADNYSDSSGIEWTELLKDILQITMNVICDNFERYLWDAILIPYFCWTYLGTKCSIWSDFCG